MSFQSPDATYFDLRRDGTILVVKENRNVNGFSEVRSGKLSRKMTQHVFSVATSKEVLRVRDSESGEQLFSQSEWVMMGLMIDRRVTDLWEFREELKDYPEKFQQLVSELKSLSKSLPLASDIKAVIFSNRVDMQRAKSIKEDTRRFYDFVVIGKKQLLSLPSLRKAIKIAHRRFPVQERSELESLKLLLKASNLKSISSDFFIEFEGEVYQIELMLKAAITPNDSFNKRANSAVFMR